jgi:hypothetical protein
MNVVFTRLPPKVLGKCDYELKTLFIDLRKDFNPARIFLHEQLHFDNPDWSETKVLREERRRWKRYTTRQRFALYKKLFNRKFRTSSPSDELRKERRH